MKHILHSQILPGTPKNEFLKDLLGDVSGNAMIAVGLALIPMVGFVGVAIDAAQWVMWKREMHSAADLAALAGARALAASQQVNLAVQSSLSSNQDRGFTLTALETPPSSGPMASNADSVRIVLTYSRRLPFSGMFLNSTPNIQVEATAQGTSEVPNCVIALDSTGGTGVDVSGSAQLSMNCGLASNSNGNLSGQLVAVPAASAVGTIAQGSGLVSTAVIKNGVAPTGDPFAALPNPDVATLCSGAIAVSVKSLNSQTINPGCYTSLKSLGSLTLNPGIYYIDGGNVTVGAQSLIEGNGVTLVFTNSSGQYGPGKVGAFSAAGNSYVILSAPTSGIYTGVLMYQDRRTVTAPKGSFLVTGASGSGITSMIQGAIYAPSNQVTFTGNSGISTDCMQIVAKFATFTGNTSVSNNCPSGSGAKAFGGATTIRLKG